MPRAPITPEAQLRRQLSWLGESWVWLMRTRVVERKGMTALDVGCGPGLVMELLSPLLDVTGVDIELDMVRRCRERGMWAVRGNALELPFADQSFDVAYCSFTLLWVKEPKRVIEEMSRVSRESVVCLAEPDYGGRMVHPREIAELDGALIGSLIEEGADPVVGRKLAPMMEGAGLEVESGTYPGEWSPAQMKEEAEAEWHSLSEAVKGRVDEVKLTQARSAWERALADGSLRSFNPVHYAIGRRR